MTILILIACLNSNVSAALVSNAILDFDNGVLGCLIPGDTYPICQYNTSIVSTGSYFAFDTNSDGILGSQERISISNAGLGITLGTDQARGTIDEIWSFAGSLGNHDTTGGNGISVVSTTSNTATINMSGWNIWYNDNPITFNNYYNPDYLAEIECATDCLIGDTFVLDYYIGSNSGFQYIPYQLHLEGTVAAPVPIPTAVWLFGSGLIGLVSFARRNKSFSTHNKAFKNDR